MKKILKFLLVAALPALFVQQCAVTSNNSCSTEATSLGFTQLFCYEATSLTEGDCLDYGGTFATSGCDQSLYSKVCDPILGGLTVGGVSYSDGAAYYGGTDTVYTTGANLDCIGLGGTLSSL